MKFVTALYIFFQHSLESLSSTPHSFQQILYYWLFIVQETKVSDKRKAKKEQLESFGPSLTEAVPSQQVRALPSAPSTRPLAPGTLAPSTRPPVL